jgi:branched-chain amino acid transport system ATP-binding protein
MSKKLLEIVNLDKSFGGVHAVNHLSFDIYEGEILGLIGPNGSGKSTCVNIISGIYKQDSGKILFNGQGIQNLKVHERSFMGITRTFQSPRPFLEMTVYDNVYTIALLYNKTIQEAKEKTDEILELCGFSEFKDFISSSLPIEKRKSLDMARCLATNPKLLMLDECLAGLNPSEMQNSIKLVRKINSKGITILFIEHVMSAVTSLCGRVVVLAEGALLSEGDPKVVMHEEKVIKAYLGEDYKI